ALDRRIEFAKGARQVTREAECRDKQNAGEREAPEDRSPRLVGDFWSWRQRETDPVPGVGRFDADEQQAAARRCAHLRSGTELLLEPRLELLQVRKHRRAHAEQRALVLRNDPHAEIAADAAHGLATLRSVGRFERRADGLELRDLGVAESAFE